MGGKLWVRHSEGRLKQPSDSRRLVATDQRLLLRDCSQPVISPSKAGMEPVQGRASKVLKLAEILRGLRHVKFSRIDVHDEEFGAARPVIMLECTHNRSSASDEKTQK